MACLSPWPLVLALGALGATACAGDAPTAEVEGTSVASKVWRSLDGSMRLTLPMDLLVQPQRRSVLGTSSDGGYRFYAGLAGQTTLPEQLGLLKDELIGLGWEVEGEQHFESAVRVDIARGKKPNRIWRTTWIIDERGQVILCEGLAREAYRLRLGDPLRAICQAVELTAEPHH